MLDIKHHIEQKYPEQSAKDLNYTKIGHIAMGTFGKWAVNIAVLGCNLGVCAGYMIFISTNLQVCGGWGYKIINDYLPSSPSTYLMAALIWCSASMISNFFRKP